MRALSAAAVVVTMLAGCSPGGEPADTPSPAFPPQTEPAEPAETEAQAEPTEAEAEAEPSLEDARVRLEPLVELDSPTAMAVRDGDDALYFAERRGVVRALRDGEVNEVLDISDETTTDGERGLLGIAFSPDGNELYLSYTDPAGSSRIDAVPMSADGADVEGRREVIVVDQPFGNHNGGNIVTGPDGMLYYGLGDGGGSGDPEENGQDRTTLLGAMLRIDPTGDDGYGVPDDNPFADEDGARPEIYAYGLRNPWRFSFDRETDDLWIADVGQNAVEEINATAVEDAAGGNYEWNIREGDRDFADGDLGGNRIGPLFTYPLEEGRCAITGGYVYRGSAVADLRGAYVYADFCQGRVSALTRDGNEVTAERDLGVELVSPVSFGEDADGELYVLSLGGIVYRLVPG